jgi:ribose transport system permease protein
VSTRRNAAFRRLKSAPEFRLLLITVAVVIFLSWSSSAFLTTRNLTSVGLDFAFIAVAGLGLLFVVIIGSIDLSIGANLGLSGMVAASLMSTGTPVIVAILAALCVGALIGAINGGLNTVFGVSSFIATLATLQIARGITVGYKQGASVSGLPDSFLAIGNGDVIGIPIPVVIVAILAIAVTFVLSRTAVGREFFAIGGSRQAALLAGVAVRRRVMAAFILSGVFAALAGVLITARLGSAVPNAGIGFELTVIAAAVIGGASLSGGVGSAAGVLLGAFLIALVNNGLVLLNVPTYWQQAFVGVVIAIAAVLDRLRRREGASN